MCSIQSLTYFLARMIFCLQSFQSIFAFNSHSALLDQANYLFVPSNLMLFGINSISWTGSVWTVKHNTLEIIGASSSFDVTNSTNFLSTCSISCPPLRRTRIWCSPFSYSFNVLCTHLYVPLQIWSLHKFPSPSQLHYTTGALLALSSQIRTKHQAQVQSRLPLIGSSAAPPSSTMSSPLRPRLPATTAGHRQPSQPGAEAPLGLGGSSPPRPKKIMEPPWATLIFGEKKSAPPNLRQRM